MADDSQHTSNGIAQ